MAALDTSVLVRYPVQDDGDQFKRAKHQIDRCLAVGQTLYVPITVALALEWVLRSRYGFDKEAVTATLSALLSSIGLRFESEAAVEMALLRYKDSKADCSDGVHVALPHQAGQIPLWTFDKAASRLDEAQLLS